MKKIIGLIFLTGLFSCDSTINIPDPAKSAFTKFYGNDGDQTGEDMVVLPDGSMLLFGTTRPSATGSTSQWYLVKVDAEGNRLWEREFGGPLDDEARDIEISAAGEVVLVGNTYKSATDRDVMIMRISFDGIKLDEGTFANPDDEDVTTVSLTSDGFVVAGSTETAARELEALKVRFYLSGLSTPYPNTWTNFVGYIVGNEVSTKIIEIDPNTYLVMGYTSSLATNQTVQNYNFWTCTAGVGGSPNSDVTYTGDEANQDKMTAAILVTENVVESGCYVAGISTNTASGSADIYVAKVITTFPLQGATIPVLNSKPLSIPLGGGVTDKVALSTSAGGFFVLANERSFNNNQNWVLTKRNVFGDVIWGLPIVYGGEGFDTAGSVHELLDGRLVLLGTMRTGRPDAGEFKMTLIKVNAEGKFE